MIVKGSCCIPAILLRVQRSTSDVCQCRRANTVAAVIVHTPIQFVLNLIFLTWSSLWFQGISDFKLAIGQSRSAWQLLTQPQNAELKSCNSLRTIGRAPTLTCTRTEHSGLNLNCSGTACSGETALRSLRGRWDSSWWDARRAGSKNWVSDKTKLAGIGTVPHTNRVFNRPADS